MQIYLRLLKYLKKHLAPLAGSVLCMIALSAITSLIAYLVKPAIDEVFIKKDFQMLMAVPVLVLVAYIAKGAADFGQSYLMGYVGNHVVTDLREEIYRHIQTLSMSFISNTSTGLLMSRIANDVGVLQRAVSDSVKKVLKNIFLIIGLTGVAFYQNWKLALLCFIVLPVVAIPIVRFGKKSRKYSKRGQERMGVISTLLLETISGNQTVKAFCMEDYAIRRFFKETDRLFRVRMDNLKITAMSSPLMEVLGGLLGAVVIYYGGQGVINGEMTTGEFFSFIAAAAMLYRPIKGINRENMKIQRGLAAAVRVFKILDTEPEIKDRPGATDLPLLKEAIEFRDVFFQYEEAPVLKRVSFKVDAGKVMAIAGPSGAGKTTIVNLLLRFYDVNSGGIFIDGKDIKDVTTRSLRQQIAFVSQETILFDDTVERNISYGSSEVDHEQVVNAAKAAYAHGFIESMPQGYNTVIGEKGVRLSGGQRQRLAIARAIVRNAPILVLDEATSALDTHSEKEVQKALENLMKGRTTILIAHRLSTVRNADEIIVMAEGSIIERGTHSELVNKSGIYRSFIDIQNNYRTPKTHPPAPVND